VVVHGRGFAMTVSFFDGQDLSNPMNGMRIKNQIEFDEVLEKL
jgi:hypothetical protein